MKYFLYLLILICVTNVYSQKSEDNSKDKKGYNLYIIYQDLGGIFSNPTEHNSDKLKFSSYKLRIPNQKDPRFLIKFTDKDSTELDYNYIGGNGSDYDFNFLYNSRRHKSFFIDKKKYLKNKLSIQAILSCNVELLYKVFKKANKIYILEEAPDEPNKYIAREVDFTRDIKL